MLLQLPCIVLPLGRRVAIRGQPEDCLGSVRETQETFASTVETDPVVNKLTIKNRSFILSQQYLRESLFIELYPLWQLIYRWSTFIRLTDGFKPAVRPGDVTVHSICGRDVEKVCRDHAVYVCCLHLAIESGLL